jgi:hydroxymethylpyrimidine/phosphomethylpyrimidine kinase
MKTALTIAGSDPGGGAGVQADIRTMRAIGVHPASVITALTVQNTSEVRDIVALPGELVRSQCDVVFDDFDVAAVKTGMLASAEIVSAVVDVCRARSVGSLVVDPVMGSTSGFSLLEDDALEVLRGQLLPLARVVTPNLPEAETLADMEIGSLDGMRDAARKIADSGARAVVVKGGHADFAPGVDVLIADGTLHELRPDGPVASRAVHGTGCAFASAIAARLAMGDGVEDAVAAAKRYITGLIRTASLLGKGHPQGDAFWFLEGGGWAG